MLFNIMYFDFLFDVIYNLKKGYDMSIKIKNDGLIYLNNKPFDFDYLNDEGNGAGVFILPLDELVILDDNVTLVSIYNMFKEYPIAGSFNNLLGMFQGNLNASELASNFMDFMSEQVKDYKESSGHSSLFYVSKNTLIYEKYIKENIGVFQKIINHFLKKEQKKAIDKKNVYSFVSKDKKIEPIDVTSFNTNPYDCVLKIGTCGDIFYDTDKKIVGKEKSETQLLFIDFLFCILKNFK